MPIALWRVSSEVVPALLKDLRSRGIVDMKRYLDENPDVVYQAMEGMSHGSQPAGPSSFRRAR
jgi:hypothetical protein